MNEGRTKSGLVFLLMFVLMLSLSIVLFFVLKKVFNKDVDNTLKIEKYQEVNPKLIDSEGKYLKATSGPGEGEGINK